MAEGLQIGIGGAGTQNSSLPVNENTGPQSPNFDEATFWSIALEVLKQGNPVGFIATGGSMSPLIRSGELVIVTPCSPKDLKPSDIILYATSSDPTVSPKRVHRIMEKRFANGKCIFFTKGDATEVLDAPVEAVQVLGKVSAIKKGRWELNLNRPWGKALNRVCFLMERWPSSKMLMWKGWRLVKSLRGLP